MKIRMLGQSCLVKTVVIFVLVLALTASVLAGCGAGGINKQTGGAVLGGIGGGLIGSRIGSGRGAIVATIAGAILGGLLGGEVGRQLDERDRLMMSQTTQGALEKSQSGVSTEWMNPDTQNYGTITPRLARVDPSTGRYCREFQQTVTVGGQTQQAFGRACRQPDGNWQIVK